MASKLRPSQTKDSKKVLDTCLFKTLHYKERIKGKVDNPWKGVAPTPPPRCSSY